MTTVDFKKELNSGEKATSVRKGWTKEEHLKFLLGVYMHGKGNWKKVSQFIRGKTPKQVQSHAQKVFLFINLFTVKVLFETTTSSQDEKECT